MNQRDHFRLDYPKPDRPSILVNGQTFEVLDISEKGIKFESGGAYKPAPKTPFRGTVIFRNGDRVDVAGQVLRYDANAGICVVLLTKGIPLPKMMQEQLTLIRKYKGRE